MQFKKLLSVILAVLMAGPIYAIPKDYWERVEYQFRNQRTLGYGSHSSHVAMSLKPWEKEEWYHEGKLTPWQRTGGTYVRIPEKDIPRLVRDFREKNSLIHWSNTEAEGILDRIPAAEKVARQMGAVTFPPLKVDTKVIINAPPRALRPIQANDSIWLDGGRPYYGYESGFFDTFTTGLLISYGNYSAREDFSLAHPELYPSYFQCWNGGPQKVVDAAGREIKNGYKHIRELGMIDDDLTYNFSEEDPFKQILVQNIEGPFIMVYDFDKYRERSADWELHDRLAYGYKSNLKADYLSIWGPDEENKAAFSYPPVYTNINKVELRALRVILFTRMYLAKLRIAKVLHPAPAWRGNQIEADFDYRQIDPQETGSIMYYSPAFRQACDTGNQKAWLRYVYNMNLDDYWRTMNERMSTPWAIYPDMFRAIQAGKNEPVRMCATAFNQVEALRSMYYIMSLRGPDEKTFRANYNRYVSLGEQEQYVSLALWSGQGSHGLFKHYAPLSPKTYYPFYENENRGMALWEGSNGNYPTYNRKDGPIITGGIVYAGHVNGAELQRLLTYYRTVRNVWNAGLKGPFMVVSNRTYQKYGHKYFEGLAGHPLTKVDGTAAMVESACRTFVVPEKEYLEQLQDMDYFFVKNGDNAGRQMGSKTMNILNSVSISKPGNEYVSYDGKIGTPALAYDEMVNPALPLDTLYKKGPIPASSQRKNLRTVIADIQQGYALDRKEYPGQSMLRAHYLSYYLTRHGYPYKAAKNSVEETVISPVEPYTVSEDWKEGCYGPEIFEYIEMNENRIAAIIKGSKTHAETCERLRREIFPEVPHFIGNPNLFLAYYKHHDELLPWVREYRFSSPLSAGMGEIFYNHAPVSAGYIFGGYSKEQGGPSILMHYLLARDDDQLQHQADLISGGRMRRLAGGESVKQRGYARKWLNYFMTYYGSALKTRRIDLTPIMTNHREGRLNLFDLTYSMQEMSESNNSLIQMKSLVFPGMYKYYETAGVFESITNFAEFHWNGKFLSIGHSTLGHRTLAGYKGAEHIILTCAYLSMKEGGSVDLDRITTNAYIAMLAVPTERHEFVFSSGLPTPAVIAKYHKARDGVSTEESRQGIVRSSRIPKGMEEWAVLAWTPTNRKLFRGFTIITKEESRVAKQYRVKEDRAERKQAELKKAKLDAWKTKYGIPLQ